MRGLGPDSRLALRLRRLRSRLGWGTPAVTVRRHVAWHWRALSVVVLTGISLALAGWVYSAGMRFAGFNQSATEQEITEMRTMIERLTAELEVARKSSNVSESRLTIESTSNERLLSQLRTLEEENNRLQADLSMFEGLANPSRDASGVSISRLQVEPTGAAGQYSYKFFLSQASERKDRELKGLVQIAATVQRGRETVMMQFPAVGEGIAGKSPVSFRHFRRMEGTFNLETDARLIRVEVRLIQDGVIKASQSVAL
jgi:hypothetical protein